MDSPSRTPSDLVSGVWTDYSFAGVLDGGGISNLVLGSNGMLLDEWHHLAVVFDNGIVGSNDAVLRFYKDGVLEREESGLPSIDCNVFDDKIHFTIGAGTCQSGNNKDVVCNLFRGWMDEVNFFAETLSEAQIIVLMDKIE